MKNNGFLIKVGDLLRNVGSKDEVSFENKKTDKIENLVGGIDGKISLQSLNDTSVLVYLDVKATLNQICDFGGEEFLESIEAKNIEAQFMLPISQEHPEEQIHDEEFLIDPTFETIDIEELVVQSILLQVPITNLCSEHKQKYEENAVELEDEYSQQGGNINFNFKNLGND